MESFGINPNDHPDATGGIFYTTNNGSDGYSGGSPYEIKMTYTTNKTVDDVLDETGKLLSFQDDKLDYTPISDTQRVVRGYDDDDNVIATWTETKSGDTWTRGKVTRV